MTKVYITLHSGQRGFFEFATPELAHSAWWLLSMDMGRDTSVPVVIRDKFGFLHSVHPLGYMAVSLKS